MGKHVSQTEERYQWSEERMKGANNEKQKQSRLLLIPKRF